MENEARDELVGRQVERGRIGALVARLASGGGGALVVAGPRGIGKSALLRDAARQARSGTAPRAGDIAVSYVVGSEAERAWPYAGLNLVASAMSAAHAGHGDGPDSDVEKLLASLVEAASTYDIARHAQALVSRTSRPTFVVVDDAHLLDGPSQEALGFVARRLQPVPVVMVMAVDPSQWPTPFDGLAMARIGELSTTEATELVRRAGGPLTHPAVAGRIAEEVGGHPRALLEVVGRIPEDQRSGRAELDRHLPWSPTLQDLRLPELDDLDESQRFALLVATGSEDGRLAPVLRALDGLDEALTAWLLDEHLTQIDDAFTLRRPTARSIMWQVATLAERRRAHEALATAYADIDPDLHFWHLAHSRHDYDDGLAARLQRISTECSARGEYERSLGFARESVRLTSHPADRAERLLTTGDVALLGGHLNEAVRLARERFRFEMTVQQRADLALLEVRARNLLDGELATGLIARHVDEVAAADPNRAARLNLLAATGFAQRMEHAEASRFLVMAERYVEEFDDRTRGMYRRAAAWLASVSGDLDQAAALLEADSDSVDAFSEAEKHIQHAMVLVRAERLEEARRLLQVITVDGSFGASPVLLGSAYSVLVMLEIRAGRLAAAREAASAWDHAEAGGVYRAVVPAHMVRALALMGAYEAAWERRQQSVEHARRHGDWWPTALVQSETGALLLLQGRMDEAVSVLEHARRYALEYADPSLLATEPDYIEACVRAGEDDRAAAALAEFEKRAAGVPTVWAQHALARCRALVSDGDESLTLFAEAVNTCADAVSPVELTRTMLCYGERLGRLGREADARACLRHAVVLAHECGASALAERGTEELSASGNLTSEIARLGELTEAERRVASLVAEGKRNREIASELFVSVRTVETHLGKIFRKVGVRSRTELTGVVIAETKVDDEGLP